VTTAPGDRPTLGERLSAPVGAPVGARLADASLVRAMGTVALAASVVNVTVGGGIFRLPAAAAAGLGAAAPLAYLVCAVAMILVVLCFAAAGSRVSLTGGPYAYIEVAFGPMIGWISGVLLWIGLTYALAAVASILLVQIVALVPVLAPLPTKALVLAAIVGLLSWLNVRGVGVASSFNTVMTVAKLLPLVLLVVVGAFAVRPENLAWYGVPSAMDVGRTALVLIFMFLGLEAALVPSGEVREPARTVPRAVLAAIGAVTVVYLLVHLVIQGILGDALAKSQTPLADAGAAAIGGWARTLILAGAIVSMFGYVSGMILASPRMLFAFARDGFFPAALARVHPRYRTPHIAIWVQTVIVLALALSGVFERLAIIANGAVLLVYIGAILAAMELRRRDVRGEGTPFRIPGMAIAPPLALVVIAFMLSRLERKEWLSILAMMAAALVLYFARRRSVRE
jgi:basic amino acid/polyamine antiporter, APA family